MIHIPSSKWNWLAELISALLIFLFMYTSLFKMVNYTEFKNQLLLYSFVKNFNYIIAWLVPGTEVMVSLLLFFPRTRTLGLYSSIILLVAFTIYLILMILFGGKHLPCTCGGVIQRMTWKQHIFFNTGFMLLNLLAIILQKRIINKSPSIVYKAVA